MDGSTVPDDKLIEVDVVRRTFLGESYYPLEGGGYRWHFMDHQTSDELLFMKMSDSNQDVKAKCKSWLDFVFSYIDSVQAAPTPRSDRPTTQTQDRERALKYGRWCSQIIERVRTASGLA